MTDFIFHEPVADHVAHTAASRLLAEDPFISDLVGIQVVEDMTAAPYIVDAIEKHPDSQEPTLSAWALRNQATAPLFEELSARHPERAKRFVGAMNAMASTVSAEALFATYDWNELGEALVVDVGGGTGPASKALAGKFPKLRFVVQDLKDGIEEGKGLLPAELAGRVSLMEHDFFTKQTVEADVYFFR